MVCEHPDFLYALNKNRKVDFFMNKNLLIIGASTYGVVASEIAADMGCFEKIDFVDDERKTTPNGIDTVGTTRDID